jgi:hypothetical protein
MAWALTFLERYHKDGNKFLNHIVWKTGDETWVSFVNFETKEQSKQCLHTHFTKQAVKVYTNVVCQKAGGNCFWDRKGGLMVEFMQQGTIITSDVYWETLKKLCRAIQNKRYGIMTSGVVLLHQNVHLHRAARTWALLEHFNWELFDNPPYSYDLAPRDYHLFVPSYWAYFGLYPSSCMWKTTNPTTFRRLDLSPSSGGSGRTNLLSWAR